MNHSQNDKNNLRIRYVEKRARFPSIVRVKADEEIRNNLLTSKVYQIPGMVCFYVSKKDEVDTLEIIKLELQRGRKRVVVPRIVGDNIELFAIHTFLDLVPGRFGVLEPKEELTQINEKEIELFIIPGIAFGRDGYRLGRGKGYYDNILKQSRAIKVGLGYDWQILSYIPHEDHDVKMDYLVSEKGVMKMV